MTQDHFDCPPARTVSTRRGAMGALGLVGLAPLLVQPLSSEAANSESAALIEKLLAESAASNTCVVTPTETEGPYPLLDALSNTSIVRRDITEDRTGLPLRLVLQLVDVNNACAPISGAAVYIWHCDANGEYSGYSAGPNGDHEGETWLRGVQTTSARGIVIFDTIFPAWYIPRITHVHVQAYLNGTSSPVTATTQFGFPQKVTQAVYANNTALYAKGQNTVVSSLDADMVFSDGSQYQVATVRGGSKSKLYAGLMVRVAG